MFTVFINTLTYRYHDHFINLDQVTKSLKHTIKTYNNVRISDEIDPKIERETVVTVCDGDTILSKNFVEQLLDESESPRTIVFGPSSQTDLRNHYLQVDVDGPSPFRIEFPVPSDFAPGFAANELWTFSLDQAVAAQSRLSVSSLRYENGKQSVVVTPLFHDVGPKNSIRFLGAVVVTAKNLVGAEVRNRVAVWYVPVKR